MKTVRIIVLVIGLLGVIYIFDEWYIKYQVEYYSTNWTSVKAKNNKYFAFKENAKSTNWIIKIEYTYDYNGKQYQGNRILFPEDETFSNEFKIQFEKNIANKKTIQVYINPDKPNESIIIKSLSESCDIVRVFFKLVLIVFLTYMFLFGFAIRYNLLEKRVIINDFTNK